MTSIPNIRERYQRDYVMTEVYSPAVEYAETDLITLGHELTMFGLPLPENVASDHLYFLIEGIKQALAEIVEDAQDRMQYEADEF